MMVKRYFFRLIWRGETIEDVVGALADSIEHAEAEAVKVIEELRLCAGLPDPAARWSLQIHNQRGVVLRSLQLF